MTITWSATDRPSAVQSQGFVNKWTNALRSSNRALSTFKTWNGAIIRHGHAQVTEPSTKPPGIAASSTNNVPAAMIAPTRTMPRHICAREYAFFHRPGAAASASALSSAGSTAERECGKLGSVTRLIHRICVGRSSSHSASLRCETDALRPAEHQRTSVGLHRRWRTEGSGGTSGCSRTPPDPLPRRRRCREVVVGEDHVGGLFRHIRSGDPHGDADVGCLQRRAHRSRRRRSSPRPLLGAGARRRSQLVFGVDPGVDGASDTIAPMTPLAACPFRPR